MAGEIVVVTGGSAGVGRAAVRAFAARGCHVAILARGRDGLEAARREVEEAGGRALALSVDVADAEAVKAAAARIEEELGPIDIWVNNAMTSVFAPFMDVTPEEYRRVTEVTYLGQVWGAQAALERMLPRDRGVIVFVGSALAYRGIPLQAAYCGAKHGIQGFFDSLRSELLHDGSGVQVSMVQMPALNTPQFRWVRSKLPKKSQPVPPIYQPEVAADAIVHAAFHPRREILVGSTTVQAVVGNKLFPGLGDRYLARQGYSGQMLDQPADRDRPDNLWEPVPGDHGAHGDFDDRARAFSPQLWANKNRRWLGLVAGLVLGSGVVSWARATSRARAGSAEEPDPAEARPRGSGHAVVRGEPERRAPDRGPARKA